MKYPWFSVGVAALSVMAGCSRQTPDTSSTTRTTSANEPLASSTGQGATGAPLSSADRAFMTKAAEGNLLEIALGRDATPNGLSQYVKIFGDDMVSDHTKANDELGQLASRKGVTLPTALDKEHEAKLDKLAAMRGKSLDRAYIDDMIEDHENDVKEFREESKKIQDPDLRAWANKTLPVLEKHLAMAKSLPVKAEP